MFDPSKDLFFDAFLSSVERFGEIASKAPVVAWLRSDALLSSLVAPMDFDGGDAILMVTEKLAAVAEGAVQATMTAGAGVGSVMMTGFAQPDLAFRIADAAFEPMHRRVSENYDRLTALRSI